MFWVEVETMIVLLGILEELWERIVVEELDMIVLDWNWDVVEIIDDDSEVDSGRDDVELDKNSLLVDDSSVVNSVVLIGNVVDEVTSSVTVVDMTVLEMTELDDWGTVEEDIGVVDTGVVVVVGGGGGITSTLLDIDAVRGYRLGFLLSAWHVIDVIWSKAGSYEKTTCKIWLHNRVFGSHEPDVMLFWPFDREMLVLESNRLNETSGFDPTLLHEKA